MAVKKKDKTRRNPTWEEILPLLQAWEEGIEPSEADRAWLYHLRQIKSSGLDKFAGSLSDSMLDRLTIACPGLVCLEYRYQHGNEITNLGPLARLKQLKELRLHCTTISDLSPLAELEKLEYLSLDYAPINNISPLARLLRLKVLTLRYTKVSDLRPLMEVNNLEDLRLRGTQVSDLSPLARLRHLKTLSLHSTQVSDLSPLAELNKIESLSLVNTLVCDLSPLTGMSQLKYLSLFNTSVRNLKPIEGNSHLFRLVLDNTQVSDLSPLEGLKGMRSLSCCGLKLDALPRFCLRDKLNLNLDGTVFSRQPAALFRLPREEILHSYYDAKRVNVNEGKVIFLGESGVGKTHTILRILESGKLQDYETESTPGVNILPFDCGGGLCIRFWDFGGQEIMHSMHRCFLTERSCYVVVVSNRDPARAMPEAKKWLRTVAGFSQQVSVLLAVNQWSNVPAQRDIDVDALKALCPALREVIFYSAKDDSEEDFNRHLTDTIRREVARLDSVKLELPESWAAIREDLAHLEKNYITLADYRKTCAKHGLGGNDEVSESIRMWLLEWFNDLGLCFSYHKNAPADAAALCEYKVLNPEWLTNGIYRIVYNGHTCCASGLVSGDDLHELLNSDQFKAVNPRIKYREKEETYILEVMRKLGRSFRAEDGREFIPETLPDKRPVNAEPRCFVEPIIYRLKLSYLPPSLLHRLMIAMFQWNDGVIWRRGVRLCDEDTVLLIEASDDALSFQLYRKENSPAFCALFHEARESILMDCEEMRLVVESETILAEHGEFVAEYALNTLLQARAENPFFLFPATEGGFHSFSLEELLFPFFSPELLNAANELANYSEGENAAALDALCAVFPYATEETASAVPEEYRYEWKDSSWLRSIARRSPLYALAVSWMCYPAFRRWLHANGKKQEKFEKRVNPMLERKAITGINRELFQWAEGSALYRLTVGSVDPEQELLAQALGPNEMERYVGSYALMKAIWNNRPELGLMPDYEQLAEQEYEGHYYSKYRDHLSHMFKVFLLGLYLYENHARIQTAISSVLPSAKGFLSVWILTALYHDVGYLIETEDGCWDSEAGKFVLQRFNDALALPLTHLFPAEFGAGTEAALRMKVGQNPPSELSQADVEEKLASFVGFGTAVRLSPHQDNNPIMVYYNYVSQRHSGRVYYDHGIVSACMLLYMRQSVVEYLRGSERMPLYKEQLDKRAGFLAAAEQNDGYAKMAAHAIALHNIQKYWGETQAAELTKRGVTISEFRIPLDELPIAYLLRLCDELQCWDRQYFTSPVEKKRSILKADKLSLICNISTVSVSIREADIKKAIESAMDGLLRPFKEVIELVD